MDEKALEYTRDHYNKHVVTISYEKAKQEREKGPAAPLKKFHNKIKSQLIHRFAGGRDALLDLACGRGGDIWKWINAEISYVKGIDLSPYEIQAAQQRFDDAIRSKPEAILVADFEASDKLGKEQLIETRKYDAVTCMFAIHYFFVSRAAITIFLSNVANNLKDGGFFFGTFPEGKAVMRTIKEGEKWPEFSAEMLHLKAMWEGEPKCFGSAYSCAIGDTVTQGHEGVKTVGSYEYLVFCNVFKTIAAEVGLFPVTDYGEPLSSNFLKEDVDKPFKRFNPHFPGSHPSLEQASALNVAFVFQKMSRKPPFALQNADPLPPTKDGKKQRKNKKRKGRERKRGESAGPAAKKPTGPVGLQREAIPPGPQSKRVAPV